MWKAFSLKPHVTTRNSFPTTFWHLCNFHLCRVGSGEGSCCTSSGIWDLLHTWRLDCCPYLSFPWACWIRHRCKCNQTSLCRRFCLVVVEPPTSESTRSYGSDMESLWFATASNQRSIHHPLGAKLHLGEMCSSAKNVAKIRYAWFARCWWMNFCFLRHWKPVLVPRPIYFLVGA